MTKKVFKSLPRLLDGNKKMYYITLYTKTRYGGDEYYHYPENIVIEKDGISFILINYRIWKDPTNHPNKPTIYPNYKVFIHRKDIRSVSFYTPMIR